MAGSRTVGSRITACQFGALSQAYSSVSVTPWRRSVTGRLSGRGMLRSSTGAKVGVLVSKGVSSLFRFAGIGGGREGESGAVHAVAPASGSWSVRKHVAEMRVAGRAAHLGAPHEERAVVVLVDRVGGERLEEPRPAGARVELGLRREQRRAAAHPRVGPGSLLVPGGAGE